MHGNDSKFDLDADYFMVPSYRISPFTTSCLKKNSLINEQSESVLSKLKNNYYNCQEALITKGGREAIELALRNLSLDKNDIVTIITPSNNKYVSGCVTKSIEKYCKWNREINIKTKVIFVIHEFGKIYSKMEELYKYNIPIIEDYAHALLSKPLHEIKSDYLIFSFPKSLKIQYGGALLSRRKLKDSIISSLDSQREKYIDNVASFYYSNLDKYRRIQKENYKNIKSIFESKNIVARFEYSSNEVPSVFMFKLPKSNNSNDIKEKLQSKGIECSYFYGENSFFIPVNYNLSDIDLDYLTKIVFSIINKVD